MIRYAFSTNPEDIFTATISTKETNPVRVLQKIIVTMRLECQKAFDDNHESEFEKWLFGSGTDAITHRTQEFSKMVFFLESVVIIDNIFFNYVLFLMELFTV